MLLTSPGTIQGGITPGTCTTLCSMRSWRSSTTNGTVTISMPLLDQYAIPYGTDRSPSRGTTSYSASSGRTCSPPSSSTRTGTPSISARASRPAWSSRRGSRRSPRRWRMPGHACGARSRGCAGSPHARAARELTAEEEGPGGERSTRTRSRVGTHRVAGGPATFRRSLSDLMFHGGRLGGRGGSRTPKPSRVGCFRGRSRRQSGGSSVCCTLPSRLAESEGLEPHSVRSAPASNRAATPSRSLSGGRPATRASPRGGSSTSRSRRTSSRRRRRTAPRRSACPSGRSPSARCRPAGSPA